MGLGGLNFFFKRFFNCVFRDASTIKKKKHSFQRPSSLSAVSIVHCIGRVRISSLSLGVRRAESD